MAKKREISIVERRLKSGSVFGSGSREIPLTEPNRWTLRVVNTTISDAHLWDMISVKGWAYAERADLAVEPHEIGFREQDGRLVRGVQGAEVMMKMERSDYRAVQKMKDAKNRQSTFGAKANKAAILSAVQQEVGGEAGAEYLNKAIQSVSVVDSRERVALED